MMKVYEVRIEKVSADWGRHEGWKNVAYTINKERAEEIATAKKAEIAVMPTWWMVYGKTAKGEPRVEVVELGEVVE